MIYLLHGDIVVKNYHLFTYSSSIYRANIQFYFPKKDRLFYL